MEKTKKNFGSKDSENNLTSTKSPKYTQLNAKATKKSNISRIVTDDAVDSNRLNPIQLRVKYINGSNAGKSGSAASLNRKQTSHIPGRIVANSKPTGTAVGDLNCTWESPLHVSTPAADGNGRDCGGNDKDVIVMTTPKTQNSKDRTSKVKLFHMSESEEIVSTARGSKNSRASKKFSNMKSTQHSSGTNLISNYITVRHCGLVGSAGTWDGTGCEFDFWQCQIYIVSNNHRAYDYLGPFGVLWVHVAWHKYLSCFQVFMCEICRFDLSIIF